MKELVGKGVSNGIAIGKLYFYNNALKEIPEYEVEDVDKEMERYKSSLLRAKTRLWQIYDSACKKVTKNESVIFRTHIMILEDSKFIELVESNIRERKNAEYAVFQAATTLSNLFRNLDDDYFKSRCSDIIDAAHILLEVLQNKNERKFRTDDGESFIIAANDLMPSDTISFNKDHLLGFVTNDGAQNSHSAILARTMGVPSIIQIDEPLTDYHGVMAIIDGQLGKVIIDPDVNIMALYNAKRERYIKQQQRLKRQIGLRSETKNKQYIRLTADITRLDELEKAKNNDAEGVGLYRSEYLFMCREKCPDEEEQLETYKTVLKHFGEHGVVIDTANGSSAKGFQYLDIPKEKNPALGFRGIRISLENREFLRTQLRALYRASEFGKLSIVLPMISSMEEIEYVQREIDKVKSALRLNGVKYDNNVKVGVMVETPAAALISDEICKRVDFVSVNTDNLIQYTLAMDRENPKLEDFYRPYHTAVKKLIKMTIDNAHKFGKKVSICGNLASDTGATGMFLAMRADELVLMPSKILKVKATVREMDTSNSLSLIKEL